MRISELGPFYTPEEDAAMRLGCSCSLPGLGCPSCMGSCKGKVEGLGSSPISVHPTEEAIFQSILIMVGAGMGMAFIARSLFKEKNPIWSLVGWFGMTGAWFATLRGVSGILYHTNHKADSEAPVKEYV